MAEEDKGKKIGDKMKMALKILLGLALIVLGLVSICCWGKAVLEVIKGCIGFVLILAGIIFVAIAKE